MVQVMGGDWYSKHFQLFVKLCVQAYLAIRPHCSTIVNLVAMMSDTGLPCFANRPDRAIKNLESRFVMERSEKAAAEHMVKVLQASFLSSGTVMYDRFQKFTNEIAY